MELYFQCIVVKSTAIGCNVYNMTMHKTKLFCDSYDKKHGSAKKGKLPGTTQNLPVIQ